MLRVTTPTDSFTRRQPGTANERTHPAGGRGCPLVLIVEDERLTAVDLMRRVESYGYEVVPQVAVTAGDAVELALFHRPDLILMDVRLKGGPDGIDAAEVILEEMGYLPIVYLTAFSNDDTVNRVRDLKPAGFLFKPIDFRRLKREIAGALNWPVQ